MRSLNYIKRSFEWYKKTKMPCPEYGEGLKVRTHREMVGGNWEELGKLQFSFMVNFAGLKPDDVLLDLACGSFRAGRLFIPYLLLLISFDIIISVQIEHLL